MSRLNYDEIKSIITEKLGFKTLADYQAFLNATRSEPTQEQIDLLSPDNVDCVAFWKVCDELFSTDPICNVSTKSTPDTNYGPYGTALSLMDANRANLWIAQTLGITPYIDEFGLYPKRRILEIGTGYGSLRNYIEVNTKNRYYGYDVIPRIAGIGQSTIEGGFPSEVQELYGTINLVVATNVFQHLSINQRLNYFDEAAKLLERGGLFIFNSIIDQENPTDTAGRLKDGNRYTYHYGQFTPWMRMSWIVENLLKRGFKMHMVQSRHDQVTTIVSQYLPKVNVLEY